MPESMKNRNILPVGTRVRPTHDKLSTRIGTVVSHSEDGTKMNVIWDGNTTISGGFMPMEIKEVKKKNYKVTMRDYSVQFHEIYSAESPEDAMNQAVDQYPMSRHETCEIYYGEEE